MKRLLTIGMLVAMMAQVGCLGVKQQMSPAPTAAATATEKIVPANVSTATPTLVPPMTTVPASPTPVQTVVPSATASATASPPSQVASVTASPLPQVASATPQPSNTAQPTASPTRRPGITQVKIYLVAIEDNGRSGKKIGCNDSIVPVEREISPTVTPLRTAIEELLSIHEETYGESGLYDALYRSTLQVQSVTLDDQGKATIKLTGELMLGGTCDDPRALAQFTETAMQFPTVKAVTVLINGRDLKELLSEKG